LNSLEHSYYRYMRFDSEAISAIQSFYLRFFKDSETVLDLGCGRGEFLKLLAEEGKTVLGIDSDEQMVEDAKGKGLQIIQADVFEYLKTAKSNFDGIFCAHLIEHLSCDRALELLSLCSRAMKKDGSLVVVCPNPSSLEVQLQEFWREPTHIRMYNRELLEFLLHLAGFEIFESGENPSNRVPPTLNSRLTRLQQEISDHLRGMRDQRYLSPLARLKRRIAMTLISTINRLFMREINLIDRNFQAIRELVDSYYPSKEIYVCGKRRLVKHQA